MHFQGDTDRNGIFLRPIYDCSQKVTRSYPVDRQKTHFRRQTRKLTLFKIWLLGTQTPPIGDLAVIFCKLRTPFPGMSIRGTIRDVDSSFTRCRLHPDIAVMFGTEFDLDRNLDDAIVFFYLGLPFGFAPPPAFSGA